MPIDGHIENYAVARTPLAAGDYLELLQPEGTRKVDVTTLGGGGSSGGPETLLGTWAGSSFTGTTVDSGTWAIVGGVFDQSDTANTQHLLRLAPATLFPPQFTLKLDVKFGAGGYTGLMTTKNGTYGVQGGVVALAPNALNFHRAGAAVDFVDTVTAPDATWHTLQIKSTIVNGGIVWIVWLNGVYTAVHTMGNDTSHTGVALYSQGIASQFRNIALYTPTLYP